MSDSPSKYREIPPEDRAKAEKFFAQGKKVSDTGNYDYAIEMYLQGLNMDPDAIAAHQALREVGLKRKIAGGKPIGMMAGMGLRPRGKDDKLDMLNAEKLLANDPGNTDHMVSVIKAALKAGFYDTVIWLGPELQKANNTAGKGEDFNKYIFLKDVYHDMAMSDDTPPSLKATLLKRAVEALELAVAMRPEDMDLGTERKNLAAKQTMYEGNYGTGGSFRDSVRDKSKQDELMRQDMDIRSTDMMSLIIATAEREYNAEPNEPGKVMKLVEALVKTEDSEHENRAIELLQQWYDKTKAFRWRLNIGKIRLQQMSRMAKSLKAEALKNPTDAEAKKTYEDFERERLTEELSEYTLWAENYPTESQYRFQAATRAFALGKYDDAIPVFQNVRMDPKYKFDASIALGRSFFEAGYIEEAIDTLHGVINDYQVRGDAKSLEMNYWYGRALEHKGDNQAALKAYSQTAQMNFNYRDVQQRIKALRSAGK